MSSSRHSLLVPEVLQSSAMDCGPAALKAAFAGFGLTFDYDWLRERCETDVNGTALDTLARVANELGLATQALVVAADTLLVPEARCLPALVALTLPDGRLHFVLLWRQVGAFVQVMDPSSGRRWMRRGTLEAMLTTVETVASAARWRQWAGSADNVAPLRSRLRELGIGAAAGDALVDEATRDESWRGFAALDAAVRCTGHLKRLGIARGNSELTRLLRWLASASSPPIPEQFRWISESSEADGKLMARGSVVLHFAGRVSHDTERLRERDAGPARSARAPALSSPRSDAPAPEPPPAPEPSPAWSSRDFRRAIQSELERPTLRPLWIITRVIRHDAPALALGLLVAYALAALLMPLEALVLQAFVMPSTAAAHFDQRLTIFVALLGLMALGLAVDVWATRAVQAIGHRVELRLRIAFSWQLPRLTDDYLQSRPRSDLATRGSALHVMGTIPIWFAALFKDGLALAGTLAALMWLHPMSTLLLLLASALAIAIYLVTASDLVERYARLDTIGVDLSRLFLDGLVGATPILAHSGQRAMGAAFDERLADWAQAGRATQAKELWVDGARAVLGCGLAIALVLSAAETPQAPFLLILAYWGFRVPELLRGVLWSQAALRNVRGLALRMLAPLAAIPRYAENQGPSRETATAAASIELRGVSVEREGRSLLQDVRLRLEPGAHVAVVGASGSGKSTLVGTLLGWFDLRGEVVVDGRATQISRRRPRDGEVAWLEPGVRLFDRSLFDNLTFASLSVSDTRVGDALREAELVEVLDQLPEGLSTSLGEDGRCLSGGQGQRVRLGRLILQSDARLVILDEPFRGLERHRRRELLARIRQRFRRATLVFVSHDVEDTLDFDQVLVMKQGRLIEAASPAKLGVDPTSEYHQLLVAQKILANEVWDGLNFRKARVAEARVLAP